VRRVEAVTGEGSLFHFRQDHDLEKVARQMIPVSTKRDETQVEKAADGTSRQIRTVSREPLHLALLQQFRDKDEEIKKLQRELEQLRMKSAASGIASVDDKIRDIKGVKVLAHRADNLDRGQMRTLVDNLRNKLGSGVVVLGSAQDEGKVALIVGVTADLTGKIQAGKVIKPVAEKVGGSGGGRPDMAEAGGKDHGQLDAALNEAYAAVEGLLK
jgi:alanyl-tRNA synthetase